MEFLSVPRNNKGEETVGFGVRLSKSDRAWLEEMAIAHGCEVSQLIRHAVEALRQHITVTKGHLITPINISAIWANRERQAIEALLKQELDEKRSAPSPVKAGAKPSRKSA
ncbi:MAG: hypothetical protein ABL974_15095 [Prosthecobacter sp.]